MRAIATKLVAVIAALCMSATVADAQVTLFTRTKPLPETLPPATSRVDPAAISGDPLHCTAELQPTADAQKAFIARYVLEIQKLDDRNGYPATVVPSTSETLGLNLIYAKRAVDYTIQVRALGGNAAMLVPLWGCITILTGNSDKLRRLGLYFFPDRSKFAMFYSPCVGFYERRGV